MNRKKFVVSLVNYIIENNIKNYNDVIKFAIYNSEFKAFLAKKKDINDYLYNLKYDKFFKEKLIEYDLCIRKESIININEAKLETINRKSKNKFHEILSKITTDDVKQYKCPYNTTIRLCRCGSKNKERLDKYTNEATFNYILNTHFSKEINYFVNFIETIIKNVTIKKHINKTSTKFSVYMSDKILFKVTSNRNFVDIDIKDNMLNDYVTNITKIYPFNYFEYSRFIIISYIIYLLDINITKYMFFNIFSTINNFIAKKYFGANYNSNYSYDMFGKVISDKIMYEDIELINTLFMQFRTLNCSFTEYIVGCYKLLIYFKNKINREIRKLSINFYDSTLFMKPVKIEHLDNCIKNYYGGNKENGARRVY